MEAHYTSGVQMAYCADWQLANHCACPPAMFILSRDCHFQEQGISFHWGGCQERPPSIPKSPGVAHSPQGRYIFPGGQEAKTEASGTALHPLPGETPDTMTPTFPG